MALPLSGQISMNDIRVELGISTQSPFGLDEARNGTYVTLNGCSPYLPPTGGTISLSDWYGYNHSTACEITVDLNIGSGGGGFVTVTNQSTLADYTITAVDTTGQGTVPTGSYDVTDYGLNNACNPPQYIDVTPLSFSSLVPTTVNVDVTCV